jgi:hypothetical protein
MPTLKKSENWKFVSEYPVVQYKCGAEAGDKLKLKIDLHILDHKGRKTGEVHKKGEIWTVLKGAKTKPVVVWLRQQDGETHTWHDSKEFWDVFVVVKNATKSKRLR